MSAIWQFDAVRLHGWEDGLFGRQFYPGSVGYVVGPDADGSMDYPCIEFFGVDGRTTVGFAYVPVQRLEVVWRHGFGWMVPTWRGRR